MASSVERKSVTMGCLQLIQRGWSGNIAMNERIIAGWEVLVAFTGYLEIDSQVANALGSLQEELQGKQP